MKRRMRRKLQRRGRGFYPAPGPPKNDALTLVEQARERRVRQRNWGDDVIQQDFDTLGWISQPSKRTMEGKS